MPKTTSKIDHTTLKATPEIEDFGHKYTEEGQGKIGSKLLDGYFKGVNSLLTTSGITSKKGKLKAIEIGCGEGYSTARLRAMLPKHVELTASEYVASLLPQARKLNPGVTIIQESAYQTTHADNSFDVVFLLEVLEHLDHPEAALTELKRILKPGGYLILGVPREPLWCSLNVARGKYLSRFGNTPGHLNHWSTLMLKRFTGQFFAVKAKRNPLPWTQLLLQK